MDILKELVLIVNKNKVKSLGVIEMDGEPKTQIDQFYQALASDRVQTDLEAASVLLGTHPKDPRYKTLKGRLKRRLINTLFFIDTKKPFYNDRQRAYYECYKEWAACKILLGKKARLSATNLTNHLFKLAMKYEFTDLIVDISLSLRLYYGTITGDRKKYERFKEISEKYTPVWLAENKAEGYYGDLILEYVNDRSSKTDIPGKAEKYFLEIEPSIREFGSYRLQLYGFLLRLIRFTSQQEYSALIPFCQQAIDQFKKKESLAAIPIQIGYYQLAVAYAQTQQLTQAEQALANGRKYVEEGSFNWFKMQETALLVAAHQLKFDQVNRIFEATFHHPRFGFLPDNAQEYWLIIRAYLQYLAKTSIRELKKFQSKEFSLKKLKQQTPHAIKDKKGYFIPILILELLYLIRQNSFDQIIDRSDALKQYCFRHLKGEDYARSCLLIKALLQKAQGSGMRKNTKRTIPDVQEELKQYNLTTNPQPHGVEIFPFEFMWNTLPQNEGSR